MIDVGAGDGLASLRAARRDPSTLAIALDPSVDRLRIGARTALRQKIANVLFVVARIEEAPSELDGAADRITITFPWGSLLRGLVLADLSVLSPLARIAKPGTRIEALLSLEARDARSGLTAADAAAIPTRAGAYAYAGLSLCAFTRASPSEISASGSSWAKRLGPARGVYAVSLRREG